MMKNVYLQTFIVLFAIISIFGCEKEEPIGPNLEDLYGAFRIFDSLGVSHNQIDFSTSEQIRFTGSWSTISNFTITIVGQTSGAIKTIQGKSSTLDSVVYDWNGTADGIFFKEEICDINLSLTEQDVSMKTTVTITGKRDYSHDGIILKTFEGTATEEFWGGNGNNKKQIDQDDAPEGSNYYYMEGTEPGNAYWIGSFAPITASAVAGTPHLPFEMGTAATTYINFFIRGHGYANSVVNFQTKIDNEDGSEGSYSYRYEVTETEWQKISIPLNELTSDDDATPLQDVDKISTIYVMLFSNGVATPKVGFDIDFIILTQGKPL
ncbi:MAG: hypothetical protein M0R02_08670 [Bacteroidales bacterium]|nr:hypothetical protein [Bacteroidales bacterium]HPY83004.1 hypothetical protein [Bacteroidales bacterium]